MVDRNNGKAWKKKNVALHQINFALATSKLRLFIGNDKPGSLMLSKEKHDWLGLIDKWKKNRNKQRRRPKTDAIIIYQDNGWPKFGTKWKAGLLKTASAISTDRTNEFYDKTDDWVLCDWPRRVHYWQMELNLRKENIVGVRDVFDLWRKFVHTIGLKWTRQSTEIGNYNNQQCFSSI